MPAIPYVSAKQSKAMRCDFVSGRVTFIRRQRTHCGVAQRHVQLLRRTHRSSWWWRVSLVIVKQTWLLSPMGQNQRLCWCRVHEQEVGFCRSEAGAVWGCCCCRGWWSCRKLLVGIRCGLLRSPPFLGLESYFSLDAFKKISIMVCEQRLACLAIYGNV